jgi:hypothetical protein
MLLLLPLAIVEIDLLKTQKRKFPLEVKSNPHDGVKV